MAIVELLIESFLCDLFSTFYHSRKFRHQPLWARTTSLTRCPFPNHRSPARYTPRYYCEAMAYFRSWSQILNSCGLITSDGLGEPPSLSLRPDTPRDVRLKSGEWIWHLLVGFKANSSFWSSKVGSDRLLRWSDGIGGGGLFSLLLS